MPSKREPKKPEPPKKPSKPIPSDSEREAAPSKRGKKGGARDGDE